jgi:hypothetical protein
MSEATAHQDDGLPAGWTTWQAALRRDDNGESFTAWRRTEPVKRAESLGHTVEWDPPGGLSSAGRWTCKGCGAAVIIYDHNIYGSAVERRCTQQEGTP